MLVILPYPPSANRYLRHTARGTYRTSEANAYRTQAQWLAKAAGFKPLDGFVTVGVTLHPKETKKGQPSATVLDLDNSLKVALDALQGVAFTNDKQVKQISMAYGCQKQDGGLTLEVLPHGR